MNQAKKDQLLQAENNLGKTLAQSWQGIEQDWLEKLRQTLSQVEGALFRHHTPSEGELLKPVDQPQKDLSPGLSRDVQSLREEHTGVSSQLNALLAGTHLPKPSAADFEGFRQAGQKLLDTLREFRETENKLVLETALRDTGGGG